MHVEVVILAILVGLAIAAVRTRDLLAATAILGAYSLMMALLWCVMNALDVGFTEAAVGAGISTVLMLAAIARVGREERKAGSGPLVRAALLSMRDRLARMEQGSRAHRRAVFGALLVCALVAVALIDGTRDMPPLGDPTAPANAKRHVVRAYIRESTKSGDGIGMPNIVTSVLGDYRGYDTMGETVVIFTAAICVLMLLRGARGKRRGDA